MGTIHFTTFLAFVFIFGADLSPACEMRDLQDCLKHMTGLTDGSDLTTVCSATDETKECLKRLVGPGHSCTGRLHQTITRVLSDLDVGETASKCLELKDSTDGDTDFDCSPLGISKCVSPMTAVSDPSDIGALCRSLTEAKACMAEYSEKCGGDVKNAVDMALTQFEQVESLCGVSNTTDSTDGDTDFDCSPLGISKCVSPMTAISDPSDIGALCRSLTEAKTCMTEYSEKCGRDVKNAVDMALKQFEQVESLCGVSNTTDSTDGDTDFDCSPLGISKCASPMTAVSDPSDIGALCRALTEAKACMTEYSEKCGGVVKNAVDMALKQFEQVESLCGVSNTTDSTDGDTDFDCSPLGISKCASPMTAVSDPSDIGALCRALTEAKACMTEYSEKCGGVVKNAVDMALKQFEQVESLCGVSNTTDSTDGDTDFDCSPLGISKCASPMTAVSDPSDIGALCRALTEAKACMTEYSEKCGGVVKNAVDMALKQFEQVESLCGVSNTTDSTDGDTDFDCSPLGISKCASPMTAVSDPSDIGALCRALTEAKACMTEYSEKCGGVVKNAVDMALKQFEQVESLCGVSNTTDSTDGDTDFDCSPLGISKCASPMTAVSDPSDIGALCRALTEAKACMTEYSEKCGGVVKNAVDMALKQFEQVESLCGVSNTTDSTDGDTDFDCSPLGISKCASPMTAVSDPSDIGALCRALTEAKACMTEYSEKCGGVVKNAVDMALKQFEQVESLCGVSNTTDSTDGDTDFDCSPLGISKCASPMTAVSDPSDIGALCRALTEAKACMTEYSEKCGGVVKNAVDMALKQFEQVESLCGVSNTTDSTDGDTDFDCSPLGISKCASPMTAVSDPSDIGALCRALTEAKACMTEYSEKCGGVVKNAVDMALKQFEQVESLCGVSNTTDFTDGDTDFDCSPLGISKCVSPMTAISDPSDIGALCRSLTEAKACMTEYSEKCGGDVKNAVDMALTQFEQVESLCGLSNTTDFTDGDTDFDCSPLGISKCASPMMAVSDPSDIGALCRALTETKACMTEYSEKCGGVVKNAVDMALKQFEQVESLCGVSNTTDSTDGDTDFDCSPLGISKCVSPMTAISDPSDIGALCRSLTEAKACMTEYSEKCGGDVKNAVDMALKQFEQVESLCGVSNTTDFTDGDTDFDCSPLGISKCASPMTAISDPSDIGALCRALTETKACMTEYSEKCGGDVKNAVDMALKQFEQVESLCGVSNTTDFTDGDTDFDCSPLGISKCVSPMTAMSDPSDIGALCRSLTEAKTCMTEYSEKCGGDVKNAVDMALKQFEQVESLCGVSNKTDSTDGSTVFDCTPQGISECVSPIEAIVTPSDLDDLCGALTETKACITEYSEKCGEVVKNAVDMALKHFEQVELFCGVSNTTDSVDKDSDFDCSMLGMANCVSPLQNLVDPSFNMDAVCSALSEAKPCLTKYVDNCDDPVKVAATEALKQLKKTEPLCPVSKETDSTDDNSDFDCSSLGISKCARSMALNDTTDVGSLCRAMPKMKSCVAEYSEKCGERGKSNVDMALRQFKQLDQLCGVSTTTDSNDGDSDFDCSPLGISKCVSGMIPTRDPSDLSAVCQVLPEAQSCLSEYSEKCSGRVKTAVDMALRQIKRVEPLCGVSNTTGQDTSSICSIDNLSKCTRSIRDMTDFSDLNAMCRLFNEVKLCMEPLMDNCTGHVKENWDTVLKHSEEVELFCESLAEAAATEDDTSSGCSTADMSMCVNAIDWRNVNPDNICPHASETRSCLKKLLAKDCTRPMKSAIQLAVASIDKHSGECISTEEEECTIESVSQCLEAMDNMEESSDSQEFCRVLSNTTTCLKKMNTGGCEPSASQLIGRVSTLAIRSKALCEDKDSGEDSDDGPTACTPENLSKCVEPHMNADFSDFAGACSALKEVRNCIGNIYDDCDASMKTHVDKAVRQFEGVAHFCS